VRGRPIANQTLPHSTTYQASYAGIQAKHSEDTVADSLNARKQRNPHIYLAQNAKQQLLDTDSHLIVGALVRQPLKGARWSYG
jgi:hypothetical protein